MHPASSIRFAMVSLNELCLIVTVSLFAGLITNNAILEDIELLNLLVVSSRATLTYVSLYNFCFLSKRIYLRLQNLHSDKFKSLSHSQSDIQALLDS